MTEISIVIIGERQNKTPDDEDVLATWGFDSNQCSRCGIKNSDLGCYLMQCASCKKVYYCSSRCFNADLEEHRKVCGDVGAMAERARILATPEKKLVEEKTEESPKEEPTKKKVKKLVKKKVVKPKDTYQALCYSCEETFDAVVPIKESKKKKHTYLERSCDRCNRENLLVCPPVAVQDDEEERPPMRPHQCSECQVSICISPQDRVKGEEPILAETCTRCTPEPSLTCELGPLFKHEPVRCYGCTSVFPADETVATVESEISNDSWDTIQQDCPNCCVTNDVFCQVIHEEGEEQVAEAVKKPVVRGPVVCRDCKHAVGMKSNGSGPEDQCVVCKTMTKDLGGIPITKQLILRGLKINTETMPASPRKKRPKKDGHHWVKNEFKRKIFARCNACTGTLTVYDGDFQTSGRFDHCKKECPGCEELVCVVAPVFEVDPNDEDHSLRQPVRCDDCALCIGLADVPILENHQDIKDVMPSHCSVCELVREDIGETANMKQSLLQHTRIEFDTNRQHHIYVRTGEDNLFAFDARNIVTEEIETEEAISLRKVDQVRKTVVKQKPVWAEMRTKLRQTARVS